VISVFFYPWMGRQGDEVERRGKGKQKRGRIPSGCRLPGLPSRTSIALFLVWQLQFFSKSPLLTNTW
jgi:hypothetical protein